MPLHTDPVSTLSGFSPFCNIVPLAVLSQLPFYWVIRPVEPTAILPICHLNAFGLRPRRSGSVLRCRICLPSPTPRNAGDMRRVLTRRRTQAIGLWRAEKATCVAKLSYRHRACPSALRSFSGTLPGMGRHPTEACQIWKGLLRGAHSLGAAPGSVSAAEGLGCEITVLGLTRHTTP